MKQSERPSYRVWYARNRKRLIADGVARNRRNKEARNAYQRKRYADNRERLLPINREKGRRYYRKNPDKCARVARESRAKLRAEFILAHDSKCACCGESEPAFLTLEHKNRDGKKDRQRFGSSSQILAYLRRLGWPKDDYEMLCFNCNRASWELGVCPHRSRI